jgi:predicted GNAT superfamily acetyltransferase
LNSVDRIPRRITQDPAPAVLALNNTHAVELSWLDRERLARLLPDAYYARGLGTLDALLLAFDETADYDSPNYLWFRRRYARFVYVDRVVVDQPARRQGLARVLYEDPFRYAVQARHETVVCEVNSEPPNPASDAFHAGFGFSEVGRASIHAGSKSARYLARLLH